TFSGRSTAITRGARLFRSSRMLCSSWATSMTFSFFATPIRAQKSRSASGVYPRRRHPRIVPSRDELLLDELQQLSLAHHGVVQVQARELVLTRLVAFDQVVDEP